MLVVKGLAVGVVSHSSLVVRQKKGRRSEVVSQKMSDYLTILVWLDSLSQIRHVGQPVCNITRTQFIYG